MLCFSGHEPDLSKYSFIHDEEVASSSPSSKVEEKEEPHHTSATKTMQTPGNKPSSSTPMLRKVITEDEQVLLVPTHYIPVRTVGSGAYGFVVEAIDVRTQEKVAIKKISNVFCQDATFQRRILRELKILQHFSSYSHANVIGLKDVFMPPNFDEFQDVYMVFELMTGDMKELICSESELEDEDIQYLLYCLLKGLNFIHTASVVHRDLKPRNILLKVPENEDEEFQIKICDFGLSRAQDSENPRNSTLHVVTRPYRAPELLLQYEKSSYQIDVWSVGCIFAELLMPSDRRQRGPFLNAKNYLEQLDMILELCGTPDISYDKCSQGAWKYLACFPRTTKKELSSFFPAGTNPLALDLLERMLTFDPDCRISVEQALRHPYLSVMRESDSNFEACECPHALADDEEEEGELRPKKSFKEQIFEEIAMWNKLHNCVEGPAKIVEEIRLQSQVPTEQL